MVLPLNKFCIQMTFFEHVTVFPKELEIPNDFFLPPYETFNL